MITVQLTAEEWSMVCACLATNKQYIQDHEELAIIDKCLKALGAEEIASKEA